MRRAFTIVELLIAMGLFGMLLAASGVIFATAVKAHRTAEATAEIAQNLGAVTDRLNADFTGLRKDCPIAIWFELDDDDDNIRHDQILFFADGDFQSYRYIPPLAGNTARVYYGQANVMDIDFQADPVDRVLEEPYDQADILARRQHVYFSDISDPCAVFPEVDLANLANVSVFEDSFIPVNNDWYEYDSISLSQWKVITSDLPNGLAYNNQLITTCFDNDPCAVPGRPGIDLDNADTLHMLMTRGVGHFRIQWSYFAGGQLRWWPSTDPDGNGDETDSDFGATGMDTDEFGIYFNMPAGVEVPSGINNLWFISGLARTEGLLFPLGFFPTALKFTFTLYDSRGVFPEGKTFTHIVYFDD